MYSSSNNYIKQEVSHKRYFLSALEIVNDLEISNKKQTVTDLQDKIDIIKLNIQESESQLKSITSEKEHIAYQLSKTIRYNTLLEKKLKEISKSILFKRMNIVKIFKKLKASNFEDILIKFSQEKRGFQSNLFNYYLENKNICLQNNENTLLKDQIEQINHELINKDLVESEHIQNIEFEINNDLNLVKQNNQYLKEKLLGGHSSLLSLFSFITRVIKILRRITKLVSVKPNKKHLDTNLNALISMSYPESYKVLTYDFIQGNFEITRQNSK